MKRRDFLKTTGVLAGTGLVGLDVARGAHAAGDDLIKVALVGCGGRGRGALQDRLTAGDNMKLVAIADVFEENARSAAEAFNAMGEDEANKGKIDFGDNVFSGFDA
ncbi:MAG: twin-arginine translocation signal domain-containing protein, partial [Thermoguttaceae bacterium]|nr:twin-arginine translocation signal domain-containing protein [Thermoguttaceae bacterium]